MNVGVVVTDQTPQGGGGYTFEMDLLGGLAESIHESDFRFFIFAPRKKVAEVEARLGSNVIEVVPYSRFDTRVIIEEFGSGLSWQCGLVYNKLFRRGGLERAAKQNSVELLWFLGAKVIQQDIPYIATVWDLQHRTHPWFPEMSARGIWDSREMRYSRFLRRATAIITGTEVGRAEIERFYQVPRDRIRILPHPSPAFALHSDEHRTEDSDNILRKYGIDENFLFYPAQFWPHKNHEHLLRAVRKLRDDHSLRFSVVFAGADKGNETYVRKRVAELGLEDCVLFLGFVEQRDVVALYRRAFALLYLSFGGPENLPPLEAFALGCPVIASQIAGAAEQLGTAALLVDPKDPDDISQAVAMLYRDPQIRKSLVDLGYQRATSWTAVHFVRGVFKLLDELSPMRSCWPP